MKALSQSPRDPDFVADPFPFYARAREAGPVFLEYGHPCAAGWEVVNAVLRDRRFGRERPGGPGERPAHLAAFHALDDHSMLEREPPAHTRLRGLVLRVFTGRRIAAMEGEIGALAERLIDGFEGPEVELLGALAQQLPVIVIARLLEVPEARADDLLSWSNAMAAEAEDEWLNEAELVATAVLRLNAGQRGEGHVGFGAGIHFCVGAALARLELRVGLGALFRRLPQLSLAEAPRFADRYHFRGLERLVVRVGDGA